MTDPMQHSKQPTRTSNIASSQFGTNLVGAIIILVVFIIVSMALQHERLLLKEALVQRKRPPHLNSDHSFNVASAPPDLETCLRNEFHAAGASAKVIITSTARNTLLTSSHVLVAGTDYGYKFAKPWVALRHAEGIPFIYFGTGELRGGELPGKYGRLPALLATMACLPNAHHLIYCDTDAILDWPGIVSAANNWIIASEYRRPLSITWRRTPYRKNGIEARTHFFVIHTHVKGARHVLNTWWYNGRRNKGLQDQQILNELYGEKEWFRNLVNLVYSQQTRHIELTHCGSFVRERLRCMEKMENISMNLRKRMAGLQAVKSSL